MKKSQKYDILIKKQPKSDERETEMSEEYRYNERSLPGSVPESDAEGKEYYNDLTDVPEEKESGYKTVMDGVPRSRGWSVVALVLAILSVPFSIFTVCGIVFPVVGLVLGVMAVLASVISRRNLGYFDGVAIAGIIISAVGFVFGITSIAFIMLFLNPAML